MKLVQTAGCIHQMMDSKYAEIKNQRISTANGFREKT